VIPGGSADALAGAGVEDMVMVFYIFTDIIIESKKKGVKGFKLFAIFPRFAMINGWGQKVGLVIDSCVVG
jgi:hypothetical protein